MGRVPWPGSVSAAFLLVFLVVTSVSAPFFLFVPSKSVLASFDSKRLHCCSQGAGLPLVRFVFARRRVVCANLPSFSPCCIPLVIGHIPFHHTFFFVFRHRWEEAQDDYTAEHSFHGDDHFTINDPDTRRRSSFFWSRGKPPQKEPGTPTVRIGLVVVEGAAEYPVDPGCSTQQHRRQRWSTKSSAPMWPPTFSSSLPVLSSSASPSLSRISCSRHRLKAGRPSGTCCTRSSR